MSEPIPLGKLIDSDAVPRDAVHVAIVAAQAGEKLAPGQDVGLMYGPAGQPDDRGHVISAAAEPKIGIVDPFLKMMVYEDQWCYVLLYPNTVTGMRHHWEHPAFESVLPVGPEAFDKTLGETRKEASRKWMEGYAAGHYSSNESPYYGFGRNYTSEEVIEFARDFLLTGDRHVQQGSETLRDHTDPAEFWTHFEVLTGMNVAGYHRDQVPFCCMC